MQATALYRHFNAAGDLLYVGISSRPIHRTGEHQRRASWFIEVARIEIEWFGTRGDAEQAEWDAIRRERPLHNSAFARKAPQPIERFVVLDAAMKPITEQRNVPAILAAKQRAKPDHASIRQSIAETIASFPIVI